MTTDMAWFPRKESKASSKSLNASSYLASRKLDTPHWKYLGQVEARDNKDGKGELTRRPDTGRGWRDCRAPVRRLPGLAEVSPRKRR